MTEQGFNEVSSPGGKIGGRTARLVADAVVYTRQRMSPHQTNVAQKILADFTNHVSDEIRGVLGPLWKQFAEDEAAPDELRPLFRMLAEERGQAWAWIAGTVGGSTVSAGLMGILNNMLAPMVQKVLSGDPNLQLSPENAASLAARGIWLTANARSEAAKSGLDENRFNALTRLASNPISPGEVIELARRGYIDDNRAHALLKESGINRNDAELMLRLQSVLLTSDQLAAMVNRDIISIDQAYELGSRVGVSKVDIDRLTQLGGDPLPPQDLGVAYRRGIIDKSRFQRGIVQGPLRKEWFDVLEKLQISRMSTVDAADAVNQGYMELPEAKRIARENGLEPSDFETLILMAGQPPGVDFATEALNRGLITQQEFTQAFLESRIKNRYVKLFTDMRYRLIPQETVRLLYRNGVYPRDKTLKTLMQHGYTADDAAALLELEEVRGDDTTRELTRAQIVDLYEEGILTLTETVEFLLGMGYSEASARAMIELADIKNLRKYINAAITRVRSAFLSGKITDAEASAQLDALRVQPGQRDAMLTVWQTDKDTISKTLSPSQIRQAVKKEFITLEEGIRRLVEQGYAPDDAALFMELTA